MCARLDGVARWNRGCAPLACFVTRQGACTLQLRQPKMSDGSFMTTFVAAWNVSLSSSAAVSVSCARSVGRHRSCQLSGRSQQPHAASLPNHVRDAGGSRRASECRQQRRRRRGLDGDRSRGCAHMAGTGRCFLGRSSAVDPERLGVGRTGSPVAGKKAEKVRKLDSSSTSSVEQ